ncbi:MAG: c-type cytochrome domain-containing protein [Planctomycetaceae bacterium]
MQRLIETAVVRTAIVLMAAAPALAAEQNGPAPDYVRDVAPLLKKYCAGCHNDGDHEGGFSVESFSALQKGTGKGPALLPGDANNSRMIRALTGGEPQMPPQDEPQPTAEDVTLLTRWIDAGAKGPDGAEPDRLLLVVPEIESHVDRRQITALAQSADGRRLAIARYGEAALFTDPSEPLDLDRPAVLISGFPGKINSVHFTPDANRITTASGVEGLGGVAAIWDANDGALIRRFDGHRDILYDAELSPDGATLATCSYDKLIILWNAETGEQLRTLDGHNGAVYDVAFSPDGRFLVTASGEATCKVWRVSDGERLDTLGQPLKEQYTCTFSPDGRTVVAGGADNRIRVWQFISTDRPRINPLVHARFAHEGAVLQIAFTADGARLVSIANDRTVKLWRTDDYTELRLWENQPDVAAALAIEEPTRTFRVARLDGGLDRFPMDKSGHEPNAIGGSEQVTPAPAAVTIAADVPFTTSAESEPNNTPAEATVIAAPAKVTGALFQEPGPDFDLFRFHSQAGQEWVIEVDAARSKSPVDSFVEVLAADGGRIERVLLQAVRDSYFTFRGKSADQVNDFRIFNWQEMTLNDYLYAGGEVVKLWMYPRGPDSGYNVYPGEGNRWGYFDTTPLSHALGEPCYIVEPHPPGTQVIPNGLPVFTLYYENDDESRRSLGKDSRLFFTAPADGDYLVKLKDVRGSQGADFNYSLTVRPRRPDFKVSVDGANPTISPGSAKEFRVKAERIDGYEGPIRVEIAGLPEGFTATSPVTIEAGQIEAMGVIMAALDAVAPTAEQSGASVVTASAQINGREVVQPAGSLGEIKLADGPKLRAAILPAEGGAQPTAAPTGGPLEFTIAPGETIMLKAAVERNGTEGEISFGKEFSGRNLPHGAYVDNIGLNGLLLLSDQNEREFFITADHWLPNQSRLFHLTTTAGDGAATPPVVLHIKRADAGRQQAAR